MTRRKLETVPEPWAKKSKPAVDHEKLKPFLDYAFGDAVRAMDPRGPRAPEAIERELARIPGKIAALRSASTPIDRARNADVVFRPKDGTSALVIRLPLRTTNPLNGQTGNTRLAGILRASRRRLQRHIVLMAVRARVSDLPPGPPYAVRLTRISAGRLDFDGLTAALKSVRDGVADALHVDDGDEDQAKWYYTQRAGPRKHYAVEIEISSARPTRTGDP